MAWKETYTTRKGEKRYRVVDRDASGKKQSKSFLRSKDADAYMLELTRRSQLGHLWQDTPQTFGEFAGLAMVHSDRTGKEYVRVTGDGWFARYEQTVRQSTFDRRKDVIRHLRDMLPIRLDRITPALVEDTVRVVMVQHPRQALFVHETIKMILRAASVRGQVVNPDVLNLRPPSYEVKRTRRPLTVEEVERLAEESDEPHLIRVAAVTGLRQGELLALHDDDVEFGVLGSDVIHVRATVYEGRRGETKTKSSQRDVPLTKQAAKELRAQMLKRPPGVTIVFPNSKGTYWNAQYLDQLFRGWRADAGLPDITFHDLRHTFASFMVEADAHPKVLQELMGHKTFHVTMKVYAHVQASKKTKAVEAMEQMLKEVKDEVVGREGDSSGGD